MEKIIDLKSYRLINQQITGTKFTRPEEIVSWLGAVQAQDYPGALWSIGLRLKGSTESTIEKSISDRKIIRTWPMRGTLHFVAAEDVRWMLALLTPKIIFGNSARLKRMGLDEKIFTRSKKIIIRKLQGGKLFTRDGMYSLLDSAKIPTTHQRGIHILWRLSQEGVLCFGPRMEKQHTFVLLEEWVPHDKPLHRDEALAKIALRYFNSHGPATIRDFAWWTGLKLSDARNGIQSVIQDLETAVINDHTYWFGRNKQNSNGSFHNVFMLPGFDEYMVAYKDRTAIMDKETLKQNFYGLVTPKIIIDGMIAGSWNRRLMGKKVLVETKLFSPFNKALKKELSKVIQKYGRFSGRPVINMI